MESLILNRLALVGQRPVAEASELDESTISRWKGKGATLSSWPLLNAWVFRSHHRKLFLCAGIISCHRNTG
jgi:hypothetical protein